MYQANWSPSRMGKLSVPFGSQRQAGLHTRVQQVLGVLLGQLGDR